MPPLVNDVVNGVAEELGVEDAIARNAKAQRVPTGLVGTADNLRQQAYMKVKCHALLT